MFILVYSKFYELIRIFIAKTEATARRRNQNLNKAQKSMAIALRTNGWRSPLGHIYNDQSYETGILKPKDQLIKSRIMKRRGISTSNGYRKRHGSKGNKHHDLAKASSTNPMTLSLSTRYINEKNYSQGKLRKI